MKKLINTPEGAKRIQGIIYKIGAHGFIFREYQMGAWVKSAITLHQFNTGVIHAY